MDDAAIALDWIVGSIDASRSSPAQCVVARLPWSSPVFASSRAPVQTDVTWRDAAGGLADPGERRLVVQQRAGAEAAGHDEDVDRRRIGPRVVRHHLQPADGGNHVARAGDREGRERRVVVGPPRIGAGHGARAREDFERPCEVEHLDIVEDEDTDGQAFRRAEALRHFVLMPLPSCPTPSSSSG